MEQKPQKTKQNKTSNEVGSPDSPFKCRFCLLQFSLTSLFFSFSLDGLYGCCERLIVMGHVASMMHVSPSVISLGDLLSITLVKRQIKEEVGIRITSWSYKSWTWLGVGMCFKEYE